jgi:protease-4
VFTGGQARQLGLVDQFGGLEEAVAKAAELAKLPEDNRGVAFLERKKSWRSDLAGLLREDDDTGSEDPFASLRQRPGALVEAASREAELLLTGSTVQARCLTCGAPEQLAAARADRPGLLARLLALLS